MDQFITAIKAATILDGTIREIPTDDLRPEDVPLVDTATFEGCSIYSRFALTFNGWEVYGMEGCQEIAGEAYAAYLKTRALPTEIPIIRACLFFEQRGLHWDGWTYDEIEPERWEYLNALLGALRTALVARTPILLPRPKRLQTDLFAD